nr:carboxypeptidase-like regulatory domain-containing protein [Flavihumibacter sp.]
MRKRLPTTILCRIVLFCLLLTRFETTFAESPFTVTAAIVVKGQVRDQNGNPLAGATITEKKTNRSVTTDAGGNFSISVTEGAILVISYVGYEPQEVAATADRDISISMQPRVNYDPEVVVTALGIKKEKQRISYATQEVKGAALEKAPEPNVIGNMVGKVAGLNIATKSNLF